MYTLKQNIINKIKSNKRFIFLFLFSIFFYSIWFIGFYPANMSPDSLSQWEQATTMNLDNAQPFIHTILISFIRFIWDSPAAIAIFQILLTSFIVSYLINLLIKRGVKKRIAFFIFSIMLIAPSIGVYNVTLWKDVIYTQLIIILCIIFIQSYTNKKPVYFTKINLLLFAIVVVLTSLVRHNGIIYLLLIPLMFYIFKIFNKKETLKFLFMIVIVFSFFNVFLFKILNVNNERIALFTEYPKIQMIANIIKNNGSLSEEETGFIEKIMPIQNFSQRYNCSAIDYLLINNSPFNSEIFKDKEFTKEFNNASLNIIKHNIPYAISDRVCLFSHLSGLGEPKWAYLYVNYISPNELNLEQHPNKFFNKILNSYLSWSEKLPQRFLFWSHFLYLLIFVFFLIKAIWNKNFLMLGFIIIILINVPIIFTFGVARDFRYLYMVQFATPFLFLIDKIKHEKQN